MNTLTEEDKTRTDESEAVDPQTCLAWRMEVYHVLCAKTGEQLFEQRAEGDEERKALHSRAVSWAETLLEMDHGPVTIWRTSEIVNPNAK